MIPTDELLWANDILDNCSPQVLIHKGQFCFGNLYYPYPKAVLYVVDIF